jgi:hypothetical protein
MQPQVAVWRCLGWTPRRYVTRQVGQQVQRWEYPLPLRLATLLGNAFSATGPNPTSRRGRKREDTTAAVAAGQIKCSFE